MKIDELIKILKKIKEDRGNINVVANIPNCEHHFFEITEAYEYPTSALEVAVLKTETIKRYHTFKEI